MMYSRKHKNAEPLMAVGKSDSPYSNSYFFYKEILFSHSDNYTSSIVKSISSKTKSVCNMKVNFCC